MNGGGELRKCAKNYLVNKLPKKKTEKTTNWRINPQTQWN